MTKNKLTILAAMLIFSLFFLISYWSPLAGDDWGYAVNGLNNNPFLLALEFYSGWSGRFFSELYGFIIAPQKWLWNLLNPSLFVLIFLAIMSLVNPKYTLNSILLILFWMLSVKDELRMEAYSWLMGTTYIIPLALSLCFFALIKDSVLNNSLISSKKQIALSLMLFYIGLTMENISVVLALLTLIILVYVSLNNHCLNWMWVRFSSISLISLIILRLSPGAALRLARDHANWMSMTLFDQIKTNYPLLIQHTFIDNKWFTLSFTLILIALIFQSSLSKWLKTTLIFIVSFALISSVSLTLSTYVNWTFLSQLTILNSPFNQFYWLLYVLILFYSLWTLLNQSNRLGAIFFLLGAGLANGSMLLSPIFGYRSSVFTLYFMMVVGLFIFNQLKKQLALIWILPILLSLFIIKDAYSFIAKYQLVHETHLIRLEQIQYYKDNPELNEAWLIRYPIFTLHSGDIEADDTYHMEVFKKYYGLKNELQLIFYYPK